MTLRSLARLPPGAGWGGEGAQTATYSGREYSPLVSWVPEGNLAGFVGVRFFEVWKDLKNVGGESPHRFEGFPGPPGPARHQK